jgi:hypothetical protein
VLSNFFFRKSCLLCDNVEKYRPQLTIWRMSIATGYLRLQTHVSCALSIAVRYVTLRLSYVRYRYDSRAVSPNVPSILSRTILYFFLWCCDPTQAITSSFTRFQDHTQRSTTLGMTPLDESPARLRNLYLTTHDTHNRQTSMPPVRFEPKPIGYHIIYLKVITSRIKYDSFK